MASLSLKNVKKIYPHSGGEKPKKAKKEAAADEVDNVKVAENDFVEKESENK